MRSYGLPFTPPDRQDLILILPGSQVSQRLHSQRVKKLASFSSAIYSRRLDSAILSARPPSLSNVVKRLTPSKHGVTIWAVLRRPLLGWQLSVGRRVMVSILASPSN